MRSGTHGKGGGLTHLGGRIRFGIVGTPHTAEPVHPPKIIFGWWILHPSHTIVLSGTHGKGGGLTHLGGGIRFGIVGTPYTAEPIHPPKIILG
jgi:hypothetical protein